MHPRSRTGQHLIRTGGFTSADRVACPTRHRSLGAQSEVAYLLVEETGIEPDRAGATPLASQPTSHVTTESNRLLSTLSSMNTLANAPQLRADSTHAPTLRLQPLGVCSVVPTDSQNASCCCSVARRTVSPTPPGLISGPELFLVCVETLARMFSCQSKEVVEARTRVAHRETRLRSPGRFSSAFPPDHFLTKNSLVPVAWDVKHFLVVLS